MVIFKLSIQCIFYIETHRLFHN